MLNKLDILMVQAVEELNEKICLDPKDPTYTSEIIPYSYSTCGYVSFIEFFNHIVFSSENMSEQLNIRWLKNNGINDFIVDLENKDVILTKELVKSICLANTENMLYNVINVINENKSEQCKSC